MINMHKGDASVLNQAFNLISWNITRRNHWRPVGWWLGRYTIPLSQWRDIFTELLASVMISGLQQALLPLRWRRSIIGG